MRVYWHAEYFDYDGGGSDYVMYSTKEEAQTRVDDLNKTHYGGWGVAPIIFIKPGQEKEAEKLWDKIENSGD